MRKKNSVWSYFLVKTFIDSFNSPLLILSELVNNGTNSSRECVQDESLQFFWWMDIFNSTLIPFIAMTIPTKIQQNHNQRLQICHHFNYYVEIDENTKASSVATG
ncbi:hypothetical protein BpHYR1_044341 [Brachionus plicatilis]|uniref:Uncharacterized protein n=1 Tax=Brachionus plicatilis TaxID=10195 RepID=A0A3M7QQY3_BRAPC|nr:hypothetical protein BpHYR1_044341 [Brachionus plicatilis]